MKTPQIEKRNWGIDALRIIAMLMIVTWHILWHGGILESAQVSSAQYYIAWYIAMLTFGAVNCYGLISGYVGVQSKFKVSNLMENWIRILFYSIIITVIMALRDQGIIGWREWLGAFFPIFNKQYWYFTAYVGAFMFFPILNMTLEKMDEGSLRKIIITLVVMFSLFTTIFQTIYESDIFILNEGYSAWWLIVLYLVGGYIKKYGILTRTRKRYLLTGYMVFSTVLYIGKVGLDSWARYARGETESVHYFITYLSPTVVLASIFLFLLFERIEWDEILKRVIKVFAPAAFGVYLIHDNRYVRNYWIHARFSVYGNLPWKREIFAIIGTAIAIYSLCSFIELIRADIFKKIKIREKIDVIDNILNLD